MHFSKFALVASASIVASASMFASASAAHDPCKVLPAAKFGAIMGYRATINKMASTGMACSYAGPGGSFGRFQILTENAGGPGADAMINNHGPGSSPPAGSGQVGGMFRQGSIVFFVSIKSNDQAKLRAVVAEIKRNLK
ncbi:MAG: hypothetical protein ABR584_07140 [Candidatus Baltobacteraceae bacterium]